MSKSIPLHKIGFEASSLVLGCMGFGGGWNRIAPTAADVKQISEAVDAAIEAGITMVDHADIYTFGKAEQVFGTMLKQRPELKDKFIIQSKCGIQLTEVEGESNRFNFSREHILTSVDGILSRLGIETLDILLLHRPDPLMEPEEVAEVFGKLKQEGKVKRLGVSNMSAAQMTLLQAYLDEPLVANQLELNLLKLDWLDSVVHVNQQAGNQVTFPEGAFEYCRLNGVQIQAWSPLARGLFSGGDLTNAAPNVVKTAELVARLAEEKSTSREAIVLAFLLRHPAGIQPVIGTANPERIRACGPAVNVSLTRDEWYKLYTTSRGQKMP